MASFEAATSQSLWSRTGFDHRALFLIAAGLLTIACASSKPSGISAGREASVSETATAAPPPSTAAAESPSTVELSSLPPLRPEEVREAVARVYHDAVIIDARSQPAYFVGDFNSDGSQDLAVVIMPAKDRLEEINNEFANWIVEDPRQVSPPDPHKSVQPLAPQPGPVKVKPGALLLTIIHGYKQEGWRNPEARQTYLLDNAVGSAISVRPLKDVQRGNDRQDQTAKIGDVIMETLAGEKGFIYWTGAKYAWKGR